jgi:2-amino-4-hydroxy-6-hydroxymethyldihydropteridine diphosphokinase
MENRRFALTPLAEIANDLQHPVLKKSIGQLLKECPDKLEVKKYITGQL